MNQSDADALSRFEEAIARILADALLAEIARDRADEVPESEASSEAC